MTNNYYPNYYPKTVRQPETRLDYSRKKCTQQSQD